MYMLRAYQSPYSMADCGPQWAQIPNLASRYHSGTCHCLSDSRVPLKGPGAISKLGWGASAACASNVTPNGNPRRERCAKDLRERRIAGAPAIMESAFRLLIIVKTPFHGSPPKATSVCCHDGDTLYRTRSEGDLKRISQAEKKRPIPKRTRVPVRK